MTKATWGGKGYISLNSQVILHHWGKSSRNSRQEVMQKPWRNSVSCLLPIACSACFLLAPRTTCPGVATPTVGWALPDPPLIKKMHHRLAQKPIWCRHFVNGDSLFSEDCTLSQVDIKLESTKSHKKFKDTHIGEKKRTENTYFTHLIPTEVRG